MARIALDLLLVLLLLATTLWCVRVHRRLVALRAGQGEIAAFVEALATATGHAERTVQAMKAAGLEAAAAQEAQEVALRGRREELARTLDGAQRMVRRLEEALGQGARLLAELRAQQDGAAARHVRPEPQPPPPAEDPPPASPARPRRRVAEDLLEALQRLR